jgi:hypothetical protein
MSRIDAGWIAVGEKDAVGKERNEERRKEGEQKREADGRFLWPVPYA